MIPETLKKVFNWLKSMARVNVFLSAAFISLFAVACTPEAPGPGASEGIALSFRVTRDLEFRDAIPENDKVIVSRIEQFERAEQKRECSESQFVGYDGDGSESSSQGQRVKATAMSSCGPSYYWFKKSDVGGRIADLEIGTRNPSRGDHILVRGRYGHWEMGKKY